MAQGPGNAEDKYQEIADGLRARIAAGEFPVGAKLPSIKALVAACGASKATVDHALAVLRGLGLVETRHGKGSYVLREIPDEPVADQLREQVAALQAQVAELAKHVEAGDDASLREKVSEIESNLIELYGKTAYEYPASNGNDDHREQEARHG